MIPLHDIFHLAFRKREDQTVIKTITIPIEIIGNLCIIENVDEAFNFRTTERRN